MRQEDEDEEEKGGTKKGKRKEAGKKGGKEYREKEVGAGKKNNVDDNQAVNENNLDGNDLNTVNNNDNTPNKDPPSSESLSPSLSFLRRTLFGEGLEIRESLKSLSFVDSLIVDPHVPSRDADDERLVLYHRDSLPARCDGDGGGMVEKEGFGDGEEEEEEEEEEDKVTGEMIDSGTELIPLASPAHVTGRWKNG